MRRDLREFVDGEHRLVGENHGTEHDILELADIARPGIALKHGEGLRVDAVDVLSLFRGEAGDEAADELGHVLEAFAQGGHPDGEDVEPVIEVLAEAPLLHEADQILVGRRDQPEVDLDRVLGADGIDLALLQRTQQLHLRIERELADLVKEQRAVTGLLEFPGPLLGSAGERALLGPNRMLSTKFSGIGAAIDRDKRPAGACAFALDGTRDQLLTDAALAFDQHGYGRIGGALPELDDPGHRLAAGDRDRQNRVRPERRP